MMLDNTGGQEDLFLALSAGGTAYVLPLSDVGQIVSEAPPDMPEILLSGRRERGGGAVIFQDDAGLAALTVGRVTGIVQLPPSRQFEMPEQARSPKNRWIAGVACLEDGRELAYLLDCRQLRARFLQEAL